MTGNSEDLTQLLWELNFLGFGESLGPGHAEFGEDDKRAWINYVTRKVVDDEYGSIGTS